MRNPLANWIPTPSWINYCNGIKEWYAFIENCIKVSEELKDDERFSLYDFVKNYEYSDSTKLNDEELKVLMADLISNASGFTPVVAVWLLHDIAKHQDVQDKLYDEIVSSSKDLRKSPYLFAFIKESMRIHPARDVFPLFSPKEGVVLGNEYEIIDKVGLACVTSNTALNPTYFEDPFTFKPERWLDESKSIHPYASTPYGIGAGKCPAQDISDFQLAIFVQEILSKYILDSDPDEVIDAQYQPLLSPTVPFDIAFNERFQTTPKKVEKEEKEEKVEKVEKE